MKRRPLLTRISALGTMCVAGCTGMTGSDSTQSPDRTPTESSTPTATPEVESQVEVPPCPDHSDSFTRESVLQFAIQFEKSYLTRKTLQQQDHVISVDIGITDSIIDKNATQTTDGWLVRFSVIGPAFETTTGHGDPPAFGANYFISDENMLRATAGKAVDPREVGVGAVVHCPPR